MKEDVIALFSSTLFPNTFFISTFLAHADAAAEFTFIVKDTSVYDCIARRTEFV